MPAVARIGDPISCGDTVKTGSANVFVNGIPVGRITDGTTGDPCGAPPTIMAEGSGTVTANGIPLLRVGDAIVPHACPSSSPHTGSVSAGSPNVTAD